MRISVRALRAGDTFRLHDWTLHIVEVDHGVATAVRTAEFGWPIHFDRQDSIELVNPVDDCFPAA